MTSRVITNWQPADLQQSKGSSSAGQENKVNAFIIALAPHLAAITGQPWEVYEMVNGDNERWGYLRLRLTEDHEFSLFPSQKYNEPARLYLQGTSLEASFTGAASETRENFYPRDRVQISVSLDRDAKAAARDINSRLMPAIKAEMSEMQTRRASWLEAISAGERAAQSIRSVCENRKGFHCWQNQTIGRPRVTGGGLTVGGYKVDLKHSEYSATIEATIDNLTPARLAKLIQFLDTPTDGEGA